MAEELDYVPLPDQVSQAGREDLAGLAQGQRQAGLACRSRPPAATVSSARRGRVPSVGRITDSLTMRSCSARRAPNGCSDVLTMASAVLVLVLLAGVLLALCYGGWPALKTFKFGFLTHEVWNPVTDQFGALAPLYGTVITSLIAMLIAVPLAFGIAVFLTETCPLWLRGPIATCIELLAAVPSIVFGIWGLFVLAPMLQHSVQPWLIDTLGDLPRHRQAVPRAAVSASAC